MTDSNPEGLTHLERLEEELHCWMKQLPALGFNAGNYDLNLIKSYLMPFFVQQEHTNIQKEEYNDDDAPHSKVC